MQLAELFAVTDGLAALRSVSCFGDNVRRCHVEGAFGLATRFFLAHALGVTRLIAGAFDFAPGFRARTLDFESFLPGALGFAVRLVTDTFGFARLPPSARRFPHAPLAFGLQCFLAQGFLAITVGFAGILAGRRGLALRVTGSLPARPVETVAVLLVAIWGASPAGWLVFAVAAPAPVRIVRTIALPALALVKARVRPLPLLCRALEPR